MSNQQCPIRIQQSPPVIQHSPHFDPRNSQFFCDETRYRKLYFSQTRKKHQTIDKIADFVVKLFTTHRILYIKLILFWHRMGFRCT